MSAWGHSDFMPSLGQVRFVPRKRTQVGRRDMSEMCQEETFANVTPDLDVAGIWTLSCVRKRHGESRTRPRAVGPIPVHRRS